MIKKRFESLLLLVLLSALAPIDAAVPAVVGKMYAKVPTLTDKTKKTIKFGLKQTAIHLFIFALIQAAQIGYNTYTGDQITRGFDTRSNAEKIKQFFSAIADKNAWNEHFAQVKRIFRPEQTRDIVGTAAVVGGVHLAKTQYALWTGLMSVWAVGSGVYYPLALRNKTETPKQVGVRPHVKRKVGIRANRDVSSLRAPDVRCKKLADEAAVKAEPVSDNLILVVEGLKRKVIKPAKGSRPAVDKEETYTGYFRPALLGGKGSLRKWAQISRHQVESEGYVAKIQSGEIKEVI